MGWQLQLVILMLAAFLIFEVESIQRNNTHFKSTDDNKVLFPIGDEVFFFGISDYLSWYEAQSKCNQLGMQLITLNSEQRWTMISDWFLQNMTPENTDSWWWTSGKRDHQENNYVWMTTGKKFSYSDWNINEPSSNPNDLDNFCVNFNVARGGWADDSCSFKLMYVCENIPI